MSENENIIQGTKEFNKDNLNVFLKELAKEYRKIYGKNVPVEIILVGGAAIIANYDFRNMTTDIDAISSRDYALKEVAHSLSNKYNLKYNWFNFDCENTNSYITNISKFAKPYKTFSNVLHFYTISEEYLIAMKLKAGRPYRSDLSDVAQIIYEHKLRCDEITLDDIEKAILEMYGDYDAIPIESFKFIEKIFSSSDLPFLINEQLQSEKQAYTLLAKFNKEYPQVLDEGNLDDILKNLSEIQRKVDYNSD